MLSNKLSKLRFRLKSVLILILGIAIGYSLNLQTVRLFGRARYATTLPPYAIEPPDVVSVFVSSESHPEAVLISKQCLVGPDGRINLGEFGSVYLAGLTISEAEETVKKAASNQVLSPHVVVDVVVYNSKTYYVITHGPGGVDNVREFPITGNETVLDAVAQVGGVNASTTTNVSIVRPPIRGNGPELTIPVDWPKIARGEWTDSNYQLLPGDRLIISPTQPAMILK